MRTSVKLFAAAAVLLTSGSLAHTASADGEHPGLTPESVEAVILPGESFDVEKTVHTPEIPPKVDVCLLEDETGSFGDDIANLQAPGVAAAIFNQVTGVAPDSQFAVAGFRDYGDAYVYRLLSTMSASQAAWEGGIAALTAGGGGDFSEAQYDAISSAVSGAPFGESCGYRADPTVARVLVVTTDATFHSSDEGAPWQRNEATTLADLAAANVTVIGLKAPGAGTELDALAAATGGSVQPLSSDGSDIGAAIVAGLSNLPVDVSMESTCFDSTGGVIDTTFAPANQVVPSGSDAVFTETISVAADAPGGVYVCRDVARLNGELMRDADGMLIYETKTILVPENFVTGGGHITNGEKGKNRATLLNFGGNAGYMPNGDLVGHWHFGFKDAGVKINTTEITALQFYNFGLEPAPPEVDADTAAMVATAHVSVDNGPWQEGCTVHAVFQDDGEPQNDTLLSFDVDCGSGAFVWENLTGGNIQIHEGTK